MGHLNLSECGASQLEVRSDEPKGCKALGSAGACKKGWQRQGLQMIGGCADWQRESARTHWQEMLTRQRRWPDSHSHKIGPSALRQAQSRAGSHDGLPVRAASSSGSPERAAGPIAACSNAALHCAPSAARQVVGQASPRRRRCEAADACSIGLRASESPIEQLERPQLSAVSYRLILAASLLLLFGSSRPSSAPGWNERRRYSCQLQKC